ncbi:MAG: sigma-70 family RNA polymerase sigma factor [Clostridia bacterium]|nr:sigma-70 family RNA polymerase sigma factor [Clostridia bacterium]
MRLPIETVVEKYKQPLFAAAFGVCRNADDADDAVQDAFIKYYQSDKEFDDEKHLRAWLIKVTVNRSKDIISSFWKRNRVSWEDYMETVTFEMPEDRDLFSAVMKLDDKYRTVIHLFYYEEYSVKEIADILGSRESTVKSQLSRGRLQLKMMLSEDWNDE